MIELVMRRSSSYVLGLFLLVSSCKRNPVSWDVDQTVPLFHSSFSLNDIDTKYLKYGVSDVALPRKVNLELRIFLPVGMH